MADNTFKIGVVIEGDDSKFRAAAKSSEKAISDLEKKGGSDLNKLKSNIAGIFSDKSAETNIGKFAQKIGAGTSALEGMAGKAVAVTGGILTVGAAAVGTGAGLFALAKQASDYGSEIKDAADKTGLHAESLSAMKLAAEQSGTSIEQITSATAKFAKGVAAGTVDLKAFGITPQEALTDLDGSLGKVFATIQKAPAGIQQMTLAQKAFGKSGADLLPFIKQFDGDLPGLIKKAKELGVVISDADAAAADDFGDTLAQLQVQAKGTANQFALGFMPKITSAMDSISNALKGNQNSWREWGDYVGGVILRMVRGTKVLIAQMQDLWNRDFNFTRTTAQLVINADEYEADRRKAEIQNNTKNAAPWLKSQFSDVDALFNKLNVKASEDFKIGKDPKAKKEKKEFKLSADGKALVEAADRLGISPLDLATIISYETKGTYSPKIRGGKGGNYTGLIQFGPDEFKKYHVAENQTFRSQLLNSVVPYFQDRFKGVGRSTVGASISDLYKTVNGGNPTVSGNASDGKDKYGRPVTINDHVARMIREHKPLANKKFFEGGGSEFSSAVVIDEPKLTEGEKLLAQFNERVAELGATTERAKLELELQKDAYKDLTEAQRDSLFARADEIDYNEKAVKATEEYTQYLGTLQDQFDELKGVEKTVSGELEKQISALKEAGVVIDEVGVAVARKKAGDIDAAAAEKIMDAARDDQIVQYRALRDAAYERVAAEQALNNELARAVGRPETEYGIANPNAGGEDPDAPKYKRKISAFNVSPEQHGILSKDGVSEQVSMMQTLKEVGMDTFQSIAGEIGNAAAQWLAYGAASGQSLGEATAAVLGNVSAQALGMAVFHTGIGIAALTPWGAALYGPAPFWFKSAAILGGIGIAAGAGARLASGGKKDSGQGSASAGSSGSSSSGQNSGYLSNNQDSQKSNYVRYANPDSSSANDMRREIAELSQTVKDLRDRISSMKPGDVLTNGIKQKPGLISDTTQSELSKNSTKAGKMGRTLGLK